MKRVCFILLVPVLLLIPVLSIASETQQDSTRPYTLGEVVVIKSDSNINPIPVAEITSRDIETRNAQTLDKALELLPGLDITRGSAGRPRVNIRGFRARHTILMLNGIPVNSTWDGQFDPNLIPTENIAKIKLTYGTHSVLYGQGGLAGVINIITKQGTSGIHAQALAQVDERGNPYTKATLSGGTDSINFFASLSNEDYEGFLLPGEFDSTAYQSGNTRENSDDKRLGFFGNLAGKPTDKIEVGLTFQSSSGEFGVPPSVKDDKEDIFYKKPQYKRIDDFENISGQLSLGYKPDRIFQVRAWIFANDLEEDNARYDDDKYSKEIVKKGSFFSHDETSVHGGTIQGSLNFDHKGEIRFSFSAQNDEYSSKGKKVLKDKNPAEEFKLDKELELYSTAIEYNLNLFSDLHLKIGYGHHWQERKNSSNKDLGNYMLGFEYDLTEKTRFRASYARKIRFPSIRQLYEVSMGNIDLTPEESDNFELGMRHQLFPDTSLDLTLFQNNVQDYIEKDDETDIYQNNEEYEFKGFEIQLVKQINDKGRVTTAYSHIDTEDKSSNSLKDELQYRPRHKLTIAADYDFTFGLHFHADFMHIADQVFYNSKFNKGELDDYTLVNLRLEQRLIKNASLFLGFDNLLDEEYEESYGYTQAGRTAYAGARISF